MDIRSLVLAARVAEAALAEKYEDIITGAVSATNEAALVEKYEDIIKGVVSAAHTVYTNEYVGIIKETIASANAAKVVIAGEYEGIIKNAVLAALASGVIPFSDAVIMSGIWGTMIVSLAVQSGHPFSMERAVKLAGAVLTGVATFKAGT